MTILEEAKRLHALGFAVLWLKKGQKAPIEKGWQKGPRKTWEELKSSYVVGYNVGVRLGEELTEGFHAVIDCDVKDPAYRAEMEARRAEILGDLKPPRVNSGRGNGSHHNHVVCKEMPKTKVLARVEGKWEIQLLGARAQVVMPPSIHPETKREYAWEDPTLNPKELAVFKLPEGFKASGNSDKQDLPFEFQYEDVQLWMYDLSDEVIAKIVDGTGLGSDQSSELLGLMIVLKRAGLTDNQVVSVFLNTENHMSDVARRHRKNGDMLSWADWLWKHNLIKANHLASSEEEFSQPFERVELNEEEAKEQVRATTKDRGWESKLLRIKGNPANPPRSSFPNACLILANALGQNPFQYDEFKVRHIYALDTPWGGKKGVEIGNSCIHQMRYWLYEKYRIELSKDALLDAIAKNAYDNRIHPVREFLQGLKWDGKPRLDTWLIDYLHAPEPMDYVKAVGRKLLCAMVARILRPGCKFDTILMLEGIQGVRKSTTIATIGYKDRGWMSDTPLDITDKDSVLNIQGNWVMELSELAGIAKTDIEHLKAFIARSTDRIRPPFQPLPQDFPRQSVLMGSTNAFEYNRDDTGGRRYWPITVPQNADIDGLLRVRDQLFAEAVVVWKRGEKIYIDDPKIEDIQQAQIRLRTYQDIAVEALAEFLSKDNLKSFDPNRFTLKDLFKAVEKGAPGEPPDPILAQIKDDKAGQMRLAACVSVCGYKKTQSNSGGRNVNLWQKFKSN